MEESETKQCPYCGKDINVGATKCEYCGECLTKEEQKINKNKLSISIINTVIIIVLLFAIYNVYNEKTQNVSLQSENNQELNVKDEKSYTESDYQAEILAYKNKFMQKLKSNYKDMLKDFQTNKKIYNDSDRITTNIPVVIIINKDGSIDEEQVDYYVGQPILIKEAILHTVYNDYEERAYFDPLPKSYNKETLVLNVIFNDNNVDYSDNINNSNNSAKTTLTDFNNVLNGLETYQARYWQIIKRNNCLLRTSDDYEEDMLDAFQKDDNELSYLFESVERKIDKSNPYLIKLNNLSTDSNSETQYELNVSADGYNEAVDAVLNNLYGYLRKTIPANDFEKLKQSEIKWLRDIENYKLVMDENLEGSMSGMVYSYTIANIRRFRCLLLMLYMQ